MLGPDDEDAAFAKTLAAEKKALDEMKAQQEAQRVEQEKASAARVAAAAAQRAKDKVLGSCVLHLVIAVQSLFGYTVAMIFLLHRMHFVSLGVTLCNIVSHCVTNIVSHCVTVSQCVKLLIWVTLQ